MFRLCTINVSHKQYIKLNTIIDYLLYVEPPAKCLQTSQENRLSIGRYVLGISIDSFLGSRRTWENALFDMIGLVWALLMQKFTKIKKCSTCFPTSCLRHRSVSLSRYDSNAAWMMFFPKQWSSPQGSDCTHIALEGSQAFLEIVTS